MLDLRLISDSLIAGRMAHHTTIEDNMSFNFTFSNQVIQDYFNEVENSVAPVSEFLYLHTHPLIQENFLRELDKQLQDFFSKYKQLPDPVMQRIINICLPIGNGIPLLSNSETEREGANNILQGYRELYKFLKGG